MHHAQQLCENIVFLLREIKSCEFGTRQTIFSTRSIYTQLNFAYKIISLY